jgi:hypothetical protein
MSRRNRNTLADRVIKAAEAALAAQDYVSPIDVLVGIGWLDPRTVERWRWGQIDCLERVVETHLARISEAMKLFRSWRPEEDCPQARRITSRARRNAGRCASAEAETLRSRGYTGPIGFRKSVFRHRGGTPPVNWLKTFSCFTDLPPERGPDRRRSGPRPRGNFARIINWLGQNSAVSRFSADSHARLTKA